MLKVYLSIEETYSSSWKLWEGVREMVQNWYDGLLASRDSLKRSNDLLKLDIRKQENDVNNTVEYCASVGLPRRGPGGFETDGGSLGKICFYKKAKCLTLVNQKTELARKILLLGCSNKPPGEEAIGQFGKI
jgi:hypothetical protein